MVHYHISPQVRLCKNTALYFFWEQRSDRQNLPSGNTCKGFIHSGENSRGEFATLVQKHSMRHAKLHFVWIYSIAMRCTLAGNSLVHSPNRWVLGNLVCLLSRECSQTKESCVCWAPQIRTLSTRQPYFRWPVRCCIIFLKKWVSVPNVSQFAWKVWNVKAFSTIDRWRVKLSFRKKVVAGAMKLSLFLQAAYNAIYSLVTSNKGFISQTKVAYSTSEFVLKDLARRYSVSWCFLKKGPDF